MTSHDKDFERFLKEYVNPHTEYLEKRRLSYLKQLKFYLLVAAIIIISLPFAEPYLSKILDDTARFLHDSRMSFGFFEMVEYESKVSQLKWTIYIIVPFVTLFIAVLPAFYYRRHRRKLQVSSSTYVIGRKITIKEIVFNHLLKFFGEFTFKRTQGVPLVDMQDAMILPDYDEYCAEDRISGVYHNTKVEISEAKLIKRHNGKKVAVFSGLIVGIDICNSDLVLRGSFKGKTVIIQDDKKDLGFIKKKFKGYEQVDLPAKELEDRFEILSTDKGEAQQIVTKSLLDSVLKLASIIGVSSKQIQHLDDRIMFWFANTLKYFGSIVISLISLPFGLFGAVTGGSFSLYWDVEPFNPSKHTDIYNNTLLDSTGGIQAINEDVTLSFYKDKVLITIPYAHDLFEPNSIFEPALVEEDVYLIYGMMNTISEIAKIVCNNKQEFTS